jgi:hypothetical protein
VTAERRWDAAAADDAAAVRALLDAAAARGAAAWTRAPAPGKWSPAAVVLHVCRAYEVGRAAADGGPGMRPLAAPAAAWLARTVVLPAMLATGRFPRGVAAPEEVVPDLGDAERVTFDTAAARLTATSGAAAAALRRAAAERPRLRVAHAYFGPLAPLTALRLLSAHTRHHARGLAAPGPPGGAGAPPVGR